MNKILSINSSVYDVYDGKEIKKYKASGKLRYYKVDKSSTFKINLNKNKTKITDTYVKLSPKVGDNVIIDNDLIKEILPRKNELIRPDVSNVDQILLVFSAKEPDFSFYLLDLFLVNIFKQNIKVILCISKIDKLTKKELENLKEELKYYEDNLDIKVFFINSLVDDLSFLFKHLKNKTTILSGQTGAGKSTLINNLLPGFNLKTNEISKALGRGKHTTRITTLYLYEDMLIGDSPGFSKIELDNIKYEELKDYFPDFLKYSCKFKDCIHLDMTVGCNINNNENIKKSRYENYLKMLMQLRGKK